MIKRLPSTVALSGWLGFALAASACASARALGLSLPIESLQFPTPNLAKIPPFLAQGFGAMFFLWVAAGMALSLLLLNWPEPRRQRLGERVAAAALTLLALGYATCLLGEAYAGTSVQPSGEAIAVIGLSALALLFDRSVAIPDADEDPAFEAAIAVIAAGMATQVRRFTPARETDR